MDAVHAVGRDEESRIGVSEAADVVGVFDARVGDEYLAADRIGPLAGDRQRGAGRGHRNPQQRRKKGAWLHHLPRRPKAAEHSVYSSDVLELIVKRDLYAAASIYHGRLESKLNQSKCLAF